MKLVPNNNFFLFLLFIYIIIIYSNTLSVPFMLDDRSHIVERPNLHLSKLTTNNVIETFYIIKGNDRKIYRPISSFTIALNYYIGKFNVTGYHIFNLLTHLLTSVFLFKILLLILNLKDFKPIDSETTINIAGLATILWAAHPIQTQAITYIVQRMASLSTLFYMLGVWYYLKFRIQKSPFTRLVDYKWLFFSLLFFICAVLSKENTAVFPLGIVLIEMFLLNSFEKIKINSIISIYALVILLIIPILFFYQITNIEKLLSIYNHKPFSLAQRILTEPKILIFYVSQLLYPTADRFSIAHSINLSNSLFSPITNLLSIAAILLVFVVGFFTRRKNRLIGFCFFFYFIHHIVESTFIPLELIFEHRNYLPSLFFFLPLSYGAIKLLSFYKTHNRGIFYSLAIFLGSIIFLLGISTYTRNSDWQTHLSLWKNAANHAPDIIRPYAQLGWYYTGENHVDVKKARGYFLLASEKEESYSVFEKAFVWLNIAKTYEHERKTVQTINALLKGLEVVRENIDKNEALLKEEKTIEILSDINYYLANNYFYIKDFDRAFFYIDAALSYMKTPELLNTKAKFLIREQKYSQANQLLQVSLKMNPENRDTFFLLGNTLSALKNFSSGRWFYGQAQKIARSKGQHYKYADLYLAENFYLSGNSSKAEDIIRNVITSITIKEVSSFVDNCKKDDPDIISFQDKNIILKLIQEMLLLPQGIK